MLRPLGVPTGIASASSGTQRLEARLSAREINGDSAAESLSLLLTLDHHEVRAVPDGPAALAALQEFRPEVVLLDMGLPDMDGYEVARRLRARPKAARQS